MIISAPRDEDEFQNLLYTAVSADRPMAVRYPRGNGEGVPLAAELTCLPVGRGELLRDGKDLALLAIGSTVHPALAAAQRLNEGGISCAVADARFAKPLDEELVQELAATTGRLVTIEENALPGGFGSAVLEMVSSMKLPDIRVECLGLPDRFIEHGSQAMLRSIIGLDAEGIDSRIRSAFPELMAQTHK